jgi:hypothetical protein
MLRADVFKATRRSSMPIGHMKYDDASWHYGGEFPAKLPTEAGATHIGMFVAWALLSGLGGEIHIEECPEDIESLRSRTLTPGGFMMRYCDGKFTDEDLNEEGNNFASAYFDLEKGGYLADYEAILGADLSDCARSPAFGSA